MWRKSSRSADGGQCVEVHNDLAALRDSKNPHGPTLNVPVAVFLATVKGGKLNQ